MATAFIEPVLNKKTDVIRVYLPSDANTLLSMAEHATRGAGIRGVGG